VSLPPAYFDRLYGRDRDPWKFRTRWYEQRKRDLTLAALPQPHYGSCFEPGCSIGVLTSALARRCDQVLAMDVSTSALDEAKAGLPQGVRLLRGSVPTDWPEGTFDLVVLSEVGYYLDPPDCARLAELAVTSADDLLAVHWRHAVADYPMTGDAVHALVATAAEANGLTRITSHVEADLRLEVWSRDGRSVAERTGLLGS
jgi:trans-aconitate methyltransferase